MVAGSIRTADDPTALDVKISIWDTEVTMRADGAELGHWPAAAVTITPIDAFSFEFVAEGDRLVFTPKNPDEFSQHPIVAGPAKSKRKRRDKGPKKEEDAPPALRWDEESATEKELRAKRARASGHETARQSRADRKQAARKAKETAAAASAARAGRTPVVDYDAAARKPGKPPRRVGREAPKAEPSIPAVAADDATAKPAAVIEESKTARVAKKPQPPKAAKEPKPAKPINEPRRPRQPKAPKETNGHSRFAEVRHRVWIRSLDFARQYDLFGLDRVPIHLDQRDNPDHAHTWNHRVAPESGPGSFICTVCGAFKKPGD